MTDLASRKYIRWDTPGVEKIPPGEEDDINAVADQINLIQKTHYNKTRHSYGGTHARTHGIVKGKFIVVDDLPDHLKQTELFEKGGEFPAVCRYSTEPGDPGLDDRIPQPRGFAIKLFDVEGKKFPAGEALNLKTQDIEFNSTPALDLANAKTTKDIIDLRIKYGGNPKELYDHLEKRDDTELQKARDQVRVTHVESTRQYSQTAYRFGNYVVKYTLVPNSETQKKLWEETVRPEDGDDILHRWLQNFHHEHEAEYLFQVQLCENLDEQPVEYAGAIWDPEKYPFQTVARLVIPPQESFDYERKMFWEDHMRVDPWLGLESFRPLGGSNRLRRIVYPRSHELRRKLNGRKVVYPNGVDDIPDSEGNKFNANGVSGKL
ncbi:heme-dependent catalase [Lophiostoma macrostomum CBS 122681]|uniref:Heme-dependent catalase n=1 Tax=Lophiostoma macrostomum CBS 122681 TaxID=1314788 RepID=A0A6A6TSM6_9PLEO|nr:heme-dependent catalase [Lophiostoma macrostomum CBS 122681]